MTWRNQYLCLYSPTLSSYTIQSLKRTTASLVSVFLSCIVPPLPVLVLTERVNTSLRNPLPPTPPAYCT